MDIKKELKVKGTTLVFDLSGIRLTRKSAAHFLEMSPQYVGFLAERGDLPQYCWDDGKGRSYYYLLSDLLAYKAGRQVIESVKVE